MKNTITYQQFSKEEIADAHIISKSINANEKEDILKEFGTIRKELTSLLSDQQRMLSSILQLRFQIENDVV